MKDVLFEYVHFHSVNDLWLKCYRRVLLVASEKFGWPMAVNYAKVAPEDRTAFENAFHNLLRLQALLVFSLLSRIRN